MPLPVCICMRSYNELDTVVLGIDAIIQECCELPHVTLKLQNVYFPSRNPFCVELLLVLNSYVRVH